MKLLEEQATNLANEAARDMPVSVPAKGLLFVHASQDTAVDEMGETKNPEEIELADGSSDDESSGVEDGMYFCCLHLLFTSIPGCKIF